MAAASCSRTRMWTCCCCSNPRSWPWPRRTPSRRFCGTCGTPACASATPCGRPPSAPRFTSGNIELNISLLDQRYLTGDRALYAGLAEKLPRFIHGNRGPLVRNLAQLARDRHAKYAGTFYHLEPNVKETPGGLRDHQLVCWLDQLHGDAGRAGAGTGGRLPLSGAAPLLSALPVRARQQRAFLRRPGRHRGAVAGGRRRPMDARVLSPRPRRLPRRHPRAGFERGPVQLALRAVPRLALARLERRFHACIGSASTSAPRNAWTWSRNWR